MDILLREDLSNFTTEGGQATVGATYGCKEGKMSEFETVLYETPAEHVARIVLNRPETRNAQDTKLLYELNAAFDRAATRR